MTDTPTPAPVPMTARERALMRLRESLIDWSGERMNDEEPPREIFSCGDVRAVLMALKDWQMQCEQQKARAQAAEARLESARRDALEEAALELDRHPDASGSRYIRAIQAKETTP